MVWPGIRLATVALTLALAAALCCVGCKKDGDDPKTGEAKSEADRDSKGAGKGDGESAGADGVPPEVVPSDVPGKLMAWLDPDAVAVMYANLPGGIDVDLLATVFALPPKAAKLLRDQASVDEALDSILDPEAPRPDTWLGPQALVVTSMVSAGSYVIRPLKKPAAEVKTVLMAADMVEQEVQGFVALVPQGPFPWRVVFLTDDVIAFIPVGEIGSGISPLTAGRDMPPSDLEQELTKILGEEPNAQIELYAQGPLVHLDIEAEILAVRMAARPWKSGGIDGQVMLHPDGDAQATATALEQRAGELETDAVRKLIDRIDFGVEGDRVRGRLQMTPEDVAAIREAP